MIGQEEYVKNWMGFKKFLENLTSFTKDILKEFEGKKIDRNYKRTLFSLIQRFHLNFKTIENSWGGYLNQPKYRYPFIILLRSLLSDHITLIYLIVALINSEDDQINEKEFKKRYEEITNGYFRRLDNEIQRLISEGKISSSDREDFYRGEKPLFPEQFENQSKNRIKAGKDTPLRKMLMSIKNLKNSESVYHYYFYFSQIEHFTKKTELWFENYQNKEFTVITGSVDYLLQGLKTMIYFLGVSQERFEELNEIIESFRKQFNINTPVK